MKNKHWDKIYSDGEQLTIWPWSELVGFVNKYVEKKKKLKVLELGCGNGPNIPFFLSLGADYFGIELSNQIASTLGSQAVWGRHDSILKSIKEISYWTSKRLNQLIFPLFNPKDSFTLIAEPNS